MVKVPLWALECNPWYHIHIQVKSRVNGATIYSKEPPVGLKGTETKRTLLQAIKAIKNGTSALWPRLKLLIITLETAMTSDEQNSLKDCSLVLTITKYVSTSIKYFHVTPTIAKKEEEGAAEKEKEGYGEGREREGDSGTWRLDS